LWETYQPRLTFHRFVFGLNTNCISLRFLSFLPEKTTKEIGRRSWHDFPFQYRLSSDSNFDVAEADSASLLFFLFSTGRTVLDPQALVDWMPGKYEERGVLPEELLPALIVQVLPL
jgi:hypothetical protein